MRRVGFLLILVALGVAKASLQDNIVPEELPEDDVSFLQHNQKLAETNPAAAMAQITDKVNSLMTDKVSKKEQIAQLKKAIVELIHAVKKSHENDTKDSQQVVNKEGKKVQDCEHQPEVDKVKAKAVTDAQAALVPIEQSVKKASTGEADYDLGDTTDTSAASVTAVATFMEGIKNAFDALLLKRLKARDAVKLRKGEAKEANEALVKEKHQCFCLNHDAFKKVYKEQNNAHPRNHELKHFHLVHCLVHKYDEGQFATTHHALRHCEDNMHKDPYYNMDSHKGLDKNVGTIEDTRFDQDCHQFTKPGSKSYAETACPTPAFPKLEVYKPGVIYAHNAFHSDVCRTVPRGAGHWTCPTGCESTVGAGAPYCYWKGTKRVCHPSDQDKIPRQWAKVYKPSWFTNEKQH